MGLHRLVSLALIGSLLHLTMVGADVACAEHGVAGGGHAEHVADHAGHGGVDETPATAATEEPCEVPSRPECCEALASCSLSMSVAGPRDSGAMAIAKRAALPVSRSLHLSLLGGPEPPPPKA